MRKNTTETKGGECVTISAAAEYVMRRLRAAGYEAYLVGGCVRDKLMGRAPNDWDICTSATPEQMQAVFASDRTVDAGLRHGTLGIVHDGQLVEATTYRAESGYSDRRHPDSVRFVTELRADLSRRDFTINAMAWDGASEPVDPFGGAADIRRQLVRCVGVPSLRFEEDALRILRALRFAARFGFAVEPETAAAIHAQYPSLRDISAERVWAELEGIVMGEHAAPVLRAFSDVLDFVLPGAQPFGDEAPPELAVRMALLVQSVGASAMDNLRCERELRRAVQELLEAEPPKNEAALGRLSLRYGEKRARQIALFHGQAAEIDAALARCPCRSLRELAVDGNDLRPMGYTGAALGAALQALAEAVIDGNCPNEREKLLKYAAKGLDAREKQ